jgi:hypothetical protein
MSSLSLHILALLRQTLLVDIICPDALNDLEDLISDVELVVELCMSTSRFNLYNLISISMKSRS